MKNQKIFNKIKKVHIFIITNIICIFLFCVFTYAHKYTKDLLIKKFADKGIKAEVKSVSLGTNIVFKDVSLKVNNSYTSIRSISWDYFKSKAIVSEPRIHGSLQDYLDVKNSITNNKQNKTSSSNRVIAINNGYVDVGFNGKRIQAQGIYGSTSDYAIKAKRAMFGGFVANDLSFKSNQLSIDYLFKTDNNVELKDSLKNKIELLKFPELPHESYNIFIKKIGDEESGNNIRATNVKVSIPSKSDNDKTLIISGDSFKYIDDLYTSGPFNISIIGIIENIKIEYLVSKPAIRNDKIRTDVYLFPMHTSINDFKLIIEASIKNTNNFKINTGTILIGNTKTKFSFNYINSNIENYNIHMPETDCASVMDANPFKSVFNSTCSSELINTGRCKDTNNTIKETSYTGSLELKISGETLIKPEVSFKSTCKFDNVPWYLNINRFKKPFTLRVGEPLSREPGNWKPRKEILTGPGTNNWIPLNLISYYIERALTVTEDGRFLYHKGIDPKAIEVLIVETVKNKELYRGGSTITMQLAKNLWLMRDKTIDRKVQELFLSLYLESIMSKSQIMELYLNIIEFGPNIYGIYNASEYYFGKVPFDLTLKESVFLSSILPKPRSSYFTNKVLNSSTNTKLNFIIQEMYKRNLITEEEMMAAKSEILQMK